MATTATQTLTPPDLSAGELTGTVRTYRVFDESFVKITLVTSHGDVSVNGDLDDGVDLAAGVAYRFFGRWDQHVKYGQQFRFDSFVVASTQSQVGIVAYLARSNLGLTKIDAGKMWRQFGGEAINVLRTKPDQAVTEGVLSHEKAHRAHRLIADQDGSDSARVALFEMFAGRGFTKHTVKAAIAAWGDLAPHVIRRDPFKMLVADLPGVGFKRADRLYMDLGHNPLRLKRQTLAAWHWMRTNGSGNTWEIEGGLLSAVLAAAGSLEGAEFARALELGIRAKWIARRADAGTQFYSERSNAWSEERLAKHVRRVLKHAPLWPSLAEGESGISDHQREKLAAIAGSPLAILAGTPGTGKTFTAAALLRRLLKSIPASRIAVCAPTGKAAVRISDAMRRYDLPLVATTIHRLLGVGGLQGGKFAFQHDELQPLDFSVVVVDESSMIDTDLAAALFAAIPPDGNVLLVGDPYQLAPVGHGAPLRDLIAGGIPCGLLDEIKRNSGAIVTACRDIKDGRRFNCSGRVDEAAGVNLVNFPADDVDAQASAVVALVNAIRHRGLDPVWDLQVLVATNDKSKVSRRQLNTVLQDVLNPQAEDVPTEARNPKFRTGDKVICLKNTSIATVGLVDEHSDATAVTSYRPSPNDAYIANGDMGRVLAVNATAVIVKFHSPDRTVKINTKKRKAAEGEQSAGEDVADFDLAYAITTHKSQGSEWPIAVVVLDESAGPIGCREWLYTAISRASRLCFLVGRPAVGWKMTAKVSLAKRKTFLKERISNEGA